MHGILDRIRREPALVTGLLSALIALATAFGLHLSAEQVGAITALAVAVLAFVTRSQVTPYSDVVARVKPADVGFGQELVAAPSAPGTDRHTGGAAASRVTDG